AEVAEPGVVVGVDGDGVGEVEAAAGEAVGAGEDGACGVEFDEGVVAVGGDPDVAYGVDRGEVRADHLVGVEGECEGPVVRRGGEGGLEGRGGLAGGKEGGDVGG